MTVLTFVLAWLALSAVSALAYMFGASVGYRRGREQAVQGTHAGGAAAPPDLAVEVRLPEDADRLR